MSAAELSISALMRRPVSTHYDHLDGLCRLAIAVTCSGRVSANAGVRSAMW